MLVRPTPLLLVLVLLVVVVAAAVVGYITTFRLGQDVLEISADPSSFDAEVQ